MITNLEELQDECLRELEERGYSPESIAYFIRQWKKLGNWMLLKGYTCFTEDVAKLYCEETLGFYVLPSHPTVTQCRKLRAIRILSTYQQSGDFEVRCPRPQLPLVGPFSQMANEFLLHLAVELKRDIKTLSIKRRLLYMLLTFLNKKKRLPIDLSLSDIDAFLKTEAAKKVGAARCVCDLRQFLSFLFDRGAIQVDIASLLPKLKRREPTKLPTTYTEEEIRRILKAIDRSSAVGKRDYLMIVLASEYGLRASDIVALEFGNFDWDANILTLRTKKSGSILKLPLTATVGNAVADYAKNGRPETKCRQMIVGHSTLFLGQPLDRRSVHSIVTKYISLANIENWQSRKHGPHALRFSLASRLQRQNVSIPVIGQVLGHRSIETTQKYINIDIASLGKCPLPMPLLNSKHYSPEGSHGKI